MDSSSHVLTPVQTSHILANMTQICSCTQFYTVLTSDGRVYSWGFIHGQMHTIPTEIIVLPEAIIQITCAYSHLIMRTVHGKVYTFGDNMHGQLGKSQFDGLITR